MSRTLSVLLICVALVTACSQNDTDSITVSGRIDNIEKIVAQNPALVQNGKVILMLFEVPFNNKLRPVRLDSISVDVTKKTFTLKGKTTNPGIYDVMVGDNNGPMVPLVNDVDEITLNLDFTNPDKFYSVQGSAASRDLRDFIFTYGDKSVGINQAMGRLDSLKQFGAPDSALLKAS
jgi:hypothetical protein